MPDSSFTPVSFSPPMIAREGGTGNVVIGTVLTEDPKLHAYVLQYAREFNCEPYTVIREALAEYLRNHLSPEF